ncbi:MAG: UbiA prenyltransferase family protein [Bacteroidetes bacterium]|nr:UbiA prenyltransferase family protein [Bacteroidota bacterium]HET6244114.1 UbiA family prenyltransferase [Bacteroidia bacterium]
MAKTIDAGFAFFIYTMSKDLKNIISHLRFPFSIFLLPVFLFALSQAESINVVNGLIIFLVLHFLVYPSSNGYNSYMDNDKASIGGLKVPPEVPGIMFWVSFFVDVLALVITYFFLNTVIATLVLFYILASRAYSYRGIRLKKHPVIGFLTVAVFQGPVIYMIVFLSVNNELVWKQGYIMSLLISFLLIGAGYPLTQIYQHRQDKKDGVKTLSLLLGIKGTFVFSAILFALLGVLMSLQLFLFQGSIANTILFILLLFPVVVYFTRWMNKTFSNEKYADYEHTMGMNKTGAFAVNVFFLLLIFKSFLLP